MPGRTEKAEGGVVLLWQRRVCVCAAQSPEVWIKGENTQNFVSVVYYQKVVKPSDVLQVVSG